MRRLLIALLLAPALFLSAGEAGASNSTWACCSSATGCSFVTTSLSEGAAASICGAPPTNGAMVAFPVQTPAGSASISTISTSQTPHGECLILSGCTPGQGYCDVNGPCWDLSGTAQMLYGAQVYVEVDNGLLTEGQPQGIQPCTLQNTNGWHQLSGSRGTYYCDLGNSLNPCSSGSCGYTYLSTGDPPPDLTEADCQPSTCGSLGWQCGGTNVSNGCGGTVGSCGTCSSGQECTISPAGQCCTPTNSCASGHLVCGTFTDSCGITSSCGTCPNGEMCNATQTSCVFPPSAPAMGEHAGMTFSLGALLLAVGIGFNGARVRRRSRSEI
jgi:hypothetical protein